MDANEKPNRELFENFILNEIQTINDATNGLIQINGLFIGAYLVLAASIIEKMIILQTGPSYTRVQTLLTGAYIFHLVFDLFVIIPFIIWVASIISTEKLKNPYMISGVSSINLQSILQKKRNDYQRALKISLLGLFWVLMVISALAGALSTGF